MIEFIFVNYSKTILKIVSAISRYPPKTPTSWFCKRHPPLNFKTRFAKHVLFEFVFLNIMPSTAFVGKSTIFSFVLRGARSKTLGKNFIRGIRGTRFGFPFRNASSVGAFDSHPFNLMWEKYPVEKSWQIWFFNTQNPHSFPNQKNDMFWCHC